jgi:MFS family permease
MTFGLMMFSYIDRQVIVSLFPHIKSEWNLSDKELGSLVSIISIVVAMGAIPVALLADRWSRVKSIVVMATAWSLATISCMFTANFGQLFAARAMTGVGESGYGSVGAALVSTVFPKHLRSTMLGAFFSATSLGPVLGVFLGAELAARWGWKAAFGVVGLPGLMLALLYLLVRDYKTVALKTVALMDKSNTPSDAVGATLKLIFGTLVRTRTLLWACIAGAMQLVTLSTVLSWLPSFLNRFQGMTPLQAGRSAALVILVSAAGVPLWGYVVDHLARRTPRYKLPLLSVVCVATGVIFMLAFGAGYTVDTQFKLILLGGLFMNSTMGVITGVVVDVIHPSMRSTGAAVLAVVLNLFGLAVGPFLTGILSDRLGLQHALAIVPMFSLLGAALFLIAMRTYDADVARIPNVKLSVTPLQMRPGQVILTDTRSG